MNPTKYVANRLNQWTMKTRKNINKWGIQDYEKLSLAMQEELGELTQAILQYQHEGGDFERIQQELDDLTALMFQMQTLIDVYDEDGF